ncbi:MAG: hypothetical protein AAB778_00805, partial [Patescibacteria group bacterium]
DVRSTVRDIITSGNGIVTGGALNVDYQATDEALALNKASHIKVYLPSTLEIYTSHYRKRASEGVVAEKQADDLIAQLTRLRELNPEGLIENPHNTIMNTAKYFERNQLIVDASDELIAFQVNESKGTQDTIDKARAKGIPVTVFSYKV